MIDIAIKSIPQDKQRYKTVGDWIMEDVTRWKIHVSELGDWRMEFAVALHELVECALCSFAGISQAEVDTFDQTYEPSYGEPGDDPKAPYQDEHSIAAGIERVVVSLLGVNWKRYEETIDGCLNQDSRSSQSRETVRDSPCA